MVEIYLGFAAFIAGFYFLWGVYDPQTQQEMEHRWMHGSVKQGGPMDFTPQKFLRVRNSIGLGVCLLVMMVAIFGRADDKERPSATKAKSAKRLEPDDVEAEALIRREADKGDAYYQHHSPFNVKEP
ncbi:MAG TPA: hypothetical protein VHV77_04415 [Pirellulales bacterium]|jgi:hypothetical protein|nr:hypothetical protein [Pirellulales bacterium]